MEKRAIDHMNADHHDILVKFCKHFSEFENPQNVKLIAINQNGMEISCDKGVVKVPFLRPANTQGEGYRFAIMEVLKSLNLGDEFEKISSEMVEFIDSFQSVIISSDLGEHCTASYAPFVRVEDEIFVLLSEIAEHFKSIKNAPNKVQILFLQNENEAKTIFARRRVSFNASAEFTPKNDEILAKFEEKFKNESAFVMIKKMSDFHIVKFALGKGRLVNGFGAAYDTNALKVISRVGGKMPHKMKK